MATQEAGIWRRVVDALVAVVGAGVCTFLVFLVLPLMQTIAEMVPRDMVVRPIDVAQLEPPPPPPSEPEPEEPEEVEQEEVPELLEEAPPLDLAQLELALDPGFGGGMLGDFEIKLVGDMAAEGGSDVDRIFSLADLDQRPRVLFQRPPTYPSELRRRNRQGTVYVVFLVDTEGRVMNPKVEKATDPAFERAALEAVRQWKFEPGTRNGQKVQFKMRVPITFNAG